MEDPPWISYKEEDGHQRDTHLFTMWNKVCSISTPALVFVLSQSLMFVLLLIIKLIVILDRYRVRTVIQVTSFLFHPFPKLPRGHWSHETLSASLFKHQFPPLFATHFSILSQYFVTG